MPLDKCNAVPPVLGCFGPAAPEMMEPWMCSHCRSQKFVRARRASISRLEESLPMGTPVAGLRGIAERIQEEKITGGRLTQEWTDRVKKIVEYLYREAWDGREPSAGFAFCVCGSAGRRQACPYSDLDAFIVTESNDPGVIAKFVDASKKVDKLLKDINSQDSTLEDKGFLFCTGGLNPLATGKNAQFRPKSVLSADHPQLIATPSEYAKFLEGFYSTIPRPQSRAHVADGLIEADLAFGDPRLFEAFQREVNLVMGKTVNRQGATSAVTNQKDSGLQFMIDALNNPEFTLPEKTDKKFNLKKQFLRLPQFIVKSLSLYYGLLEIEPDRQLKELTRQGLINQNTAKLFQPFDAVQRIRVSAHLAMRGEIDDVCMPGYTGPGCEKCYVLTDREKHELLNCIDNLTILRSVAEEWKNNKMKVWGIRRSPFRKNPPSVAQARIG